MTPTRIMFIAGEASGDTLAAELVQALRPALAARQARPTNDAQPLRTSLAPELFGAGGPNLAAAGVDLAFDLTLHSVIGLADVLKNYSKFKRLFDQLVALAIERQPEVIICVDFSGFNRRFARAIRRHVRAHPGPFHNWNPKIIQYISPQVWASREGRARRMEGDFDLLLSIFPFEKAWYAARVPRLRVEFIGHPVIDRYAGALLAMRNGQADPAHPTLVLLPGSRRAELKRHLPVMLAACAAVQQARPETRARMVLPNENLARTAREFIGAQAGVDTQVGGLAEALSHATTALASSGTVTMECACFGVPTVAIYKTSWSTYEIARRIIRVKYVAMPNLLAGEEIFPEFIQAAATPENLARATLALLNDAPRRAAIKGRLAEIIATLGDPGANARAARAVVELLK